MDLSTSQYGELILSAYKCFHYVSSVLYETYQSIGRICTSYPPILELILSAFKHQ